MTELINKLKRNSMLKNLFIGSFLLGTKGILIFSLVFLILLFYKEYYKKNLFNFLLLIKECIFFKYILSLIYPNSSMIKESIRLLILVFICELFYKYKYKIKIKLENITWFMLILFLFGILWNYFSFGGVSSVESYIDSNLNLLLPLLLSMYLIKKENRKYIIQFLPLVGIGFLVKNIDLKNIDYSLYILKGNMISIFSVILPFTFFLLLEVKNRKIKLFYFFTMILNIILVIKLGARAGLYSGILTIFLILLLNQNIKKILISISFIIVLVFMMSQNLNVQNQFFKYRDFSTRSREYLIRAGIYCFKRNLIFGVGNNNTQKYFIEYSEKQFLEENTLKNSYEVEALKNDYLRNFPDTHNIIFDFLAQNGIYGILFSIILLVLPVNMIFSYLKDCKRLEYLKYIGAVVGFLISGQTWSLWTRHNAGVKYLIIIIILYYYEKKGRKDEKNNF